MKLVCDSIIDLNLSMKAILFTQGGKAGCSLMTNTTKVLLNFPKKKEQKMYF